MDANTLPSVAVHCLRSTDYINVIVADKAEAPAVHDHRRGQHSLRAKGLGICSRASTDAGEELMSCWCCVPTWQQRRHWPRRRSRATGCRTSSCASVNVVIDPGCSRRPLIRTDRRSATSIVSSPLTSRSSSNFHGYPWLIHRLAYRFKGHGNNARARLQEGTSYFCSSSLANTCNETSRFQSRHRRHRSSAQAVHMSTLHLKEEMRNAIIDNPRYAHEQGTDRPEDRQLDLAVTWSHPGASAPGPP